MAMLRPPSTRHTLSEPFPLQLLAALIKAKEQANPAGWLAFQTEVSALKLQASGPHSWACVHAAYEFPRTPLLPAFPSQQHVLLKRCPS